MPVRIFPLLSLVTALSLGILGIPTRASAEANPPAACPPDWLGTSISANPQISADGRYVVFAGYGDGEIGERVIFLRDLKRDRTTVVSDLSVHLFNFLPSISADGNRISYLSRDPLAHGNDADVWVYDRRTEDRTYEGVSFTQHVPALDAHGRHVTFTRLLDGSPNRVSVMIRDIDRDSESLVSANLDGEPADRTSLEPRISANGRLVVFRSYASDLTEDPVEPDNDGGIYLRNVRTGRTSLIPDRNGGNTIERSNQQISPDGRYVLYSDNEGTWRFDRRTGRTVAASNGAYGGSVGIGAKGRQVLLITADGLMVRNVRTGRQTWVDLRPNGTPTQSGGWPGAMTPSGRHVVFQAEATDLDAAETAQAPLNVYVRDLKTRRTELVSSTDAGGSCE